MYNKIIEFIKEKHNFKDYVALHEPVFNGNEKKYLLECLKSTYVSSIGPFVDRFELMLNEITQTNKTTAVVNGTAALQVALRLVGVRANDEVITQSLTFIATANAIVYNNAHPIFLDVDLDTMGLSPKALNEFLEEFGELRESGCYNKSTGRKISACIPMHTFGFPVHIDELINICNLWKIPVVEDAAESLGSLYKGLPTGSFGEVAAFSFNGNKITTAGAGGAITTKNVVLGERAKFLTTTAKEPHNYEFIHNEIGYNYRMPNINAAIGCAQLEQLERFISNKRKLAKDYESYFKTIGIKFRTEPKNTRANYWLMCIELDNKNEASKFLKYSSESNVMSRPVWQLMPRLPMYADCQRDGMKNATKLKDIIINIPSSVTR
jgi:perosamine synthetase